MKAQVACCQEKDLTNTEATNWSQPEEEMSGDPNGQGLPRWPAERDRL